MASTPPKDTDDTVGNLTKAVAQQKRAKSPPLAFEETPNDSLYPLVPGHSHNSGTTSPAKQRVGDTQSDDMIDLHSLVRQQASAIDLLHNAFGAERQAWIMEREKLYLRIAKLERLLNAGNGHSPAKSPVLSPQNLSGLTSPFARVGSGANRLSSIAEDENLSPLSMSLSQQREEATQSNATPAPHSNSPPRSRRTSGSVSFREGTPDAIIVQEIPHSPAPTRTLSPPPYHYRLEAGHTPLKATRPPTPPPQNTMDGIEDTPTRNNTHINSISSWENDDEEDKELKGPLSMPELPHKPDASNFTLEMLSKRLEQIEQHPEETHSKPMVFNEPSPGLASPAEPIEQHNLNRKHASDGEVPLAPVSSHLPAADLDSGTSRHGSNALSPKAALSPLSKHASRDQGEDKVHSDFETGGIKLKKKPSVNFGAPFGQLGGFGSMRKQS